MERLVSGICTLSKHRKEDMEKNEHRRRTQLAGWAEHKEMHCCSSYGKEDIMVELSNGWENKSSYCPKEAKMVNASF